MRSSSMQAAGGHASSAWAPGPRALGKTVRNPRARVHGVLGWAGALLLALAPVAAAQDDCPDLATLDTATIVVGTATGNPGDTVEVPVDLSAGTPAPTGVLVSIQFGAIQGTIHVAPDAGFYPASGGALPVRLPAALDALGYTIEQETFDNRINVLVIHRTDPDPTPLPNGRLFTLALRVLPDAPGSGTIALDDNAGTSSATHIVGDDDEDDDNSACPVPVAVDGGAVNLGCPTLPPPSDVQATTARSDGVLVTWTGVEPGALYRVYRNTTPNAAGAVPLGPGPSTATSFLDTTAATPLVMAGCVGETITPVTFFYFVRSQPPGGCEGAFSSPPAPGTRTTAGRAAQAHAQPVWPALRTSPTHVVAAAGETVALRLAGAAPVDEATVSATRDGAPAPVRWRAADDGSGWAQVRVPRGLAAGETLRIAALAQTMDGAPVGPVAIEVQVASSAARAQAVALSPAAGAPALPDAVGPAYTLTPAAVFDTPRLIELPVPATGRELTLYWRPEAAAGAAWQPVESVPGLIASPAPVLIRDGGVQYWRATLQHGGVLQWGGAMDEAATARAAGVPGVQPATLALWAGLCMVLLAWRVLRRTAS